MRQNETERVFEKAVEISLVLILFLVITYFISALPAMASLSDNLTKLMGY